MYAERDVYAVALAGLKTAATCRDVPSDRAQSDAPDTKRTHQRPQPAERTQRRLWSADPNQGCPGLLPLLSSGRNMAPQVCVGPGHSWAGLAQSWRSFVTLL